MASKTSWRHILLTVPGLVGCIALGMVAASLYDTRRVIQATGVDVLLDMARPISERPRMVEVVVVESPVPGEAPRGCQFRDGPLLSALATARCTPETRVAGMSAVVLAPGERREEPIQRTFVFPVPESVHAGAIATTDTAQWRHVGRLTAPELSDRLGERRHFHLIGMRVDGREILDLDHLADGGHSRIVPEGSGIALAFASPFATVTEVNSLAASVSKWLAGWDNILGNAIIGLLVALMVACPLALAVALRYLDFAVFVPVKWRYFRRGDHPLAGLEREVAAIGPSQLEKRQITAQHLDHHHARLLDLSDEMRREQGAPQDGRCYLAEVMRSTADQWGATGRTPMESFEPLIDEVEERHEHEPGIALLEYVAAAGPSLGFLGTALGMAKAFEQMDGARMGMSTGFSTAMKVALATTILGLLAKLLSQICLRIFDAQLERRMVAMRHNLVRWAAIFDRLIALRNQLPSAAAARQSATGRS